MVYDRGQLNQSLTSMVGIHACSFSAIDEILRIEYKLHCIAIKKVFISDSNKLSEVIINKMDTVVSLIHHA